MCKQIDGCDNPDHLKGKPHNCSLEQIKTCYGHELSHPCLKHKKVIDKKDA